MSTDATGPNTQPEPEPERGVELAAERTPEQQPESTAEADSEPPPRLPHPLDAVTKRHLELGPGGYLWVLNVAEVENECVDIVPGCQLRRANADEVNDLRTLIRHYQAKMYGRNPWETITIVSPSEIPGTESISYQELPETKFRYHVLEYKDPSNLIMWRVCLASVLAKGPYFDQGYTVMRFAALPGGGAVPSGVGSSRTLDRLLGQNFTLRDRDQEKYFARFSHSDTDDLVATLGQLDEAADRHAEEIKASVDAFLAMMEVTHSDMRLLGLFTILESQLTHKPDPQDRHQSLIRQIEKKLTLLGNRFVRPVNYIAHLGSSASIETIWKKLYQLRSNIAHGSRPDFNKDLKILKDRETAEVLVVDVVRSLLRQFLHEPQLMRDLREC